MANVVDYINDFFAGGEEALRNIEKELERSFIKNILAPAKKISYFHYRKRYRKIYEDFSIKCSRKFERSFEKH